jgi:hypothetical protein
MAHSFAGTLPSATSIGQNSVDKGCRDCWQLAIQATEKDSGSQPAGDGEVLVDKDAD